MSTRFRAGRSLMPCVSLLVWSISLGLIFPDGVPAEPVADSATEPIPGSIPAATASENSEPTAEYKTFEAVLEKFRAEYKSRLTNSAESYLTDLATRLNRQLEQNEEKPLSVKDQLAAFEDAAEMLRAYSIQFETLQQEFGKGKPLSLKFSALTTAINALTDAEKTKANAAIVEEAALKKLVENKAFNAETREALKLFYERGQGVATKLKNQWLEIKKPFIESATSDEVRTALVEKLPKWKEIVLEVRRLRVARDSAKPVLALLPQEAVGAAAPVTATTGGEAGVQPAEIHQAAKALNVAIDANKCADGTTENGLATELSEGLETLKAQLVKVSQDQNTQLPTLLEAVNKFKSASHIRSHLIELNDASKELIELRQLDERARELLRLYLGASSNAKSVEVATELDKLQTLISLMESALDLVDEGLGGDMDTFVNDQIRLFYFTDVPRLMRILNPGFIEVNGEQAALLRTEAQAARSTLSSARESLAAEWAQVNNLRSRSLEIDSEIKRARLREADTERRLDRMDDRLQKPKARLRELEDEKKELEKPDGDAARLTAVKSEIEKLTAQLKPLDDERSAIAQTLANVRAQFKSVREEEQDLPTQLEAATKALSSSQVLVKTSRDKILQAAIAESQAFASLRDNESFFWGKANSSSTDPARRVSLYGFHDSKILFLRGKPEDVRRAKEIIAGFDRPAPQARITLWTLQVNGSDSKKINKTLAEIDSGLSSMRGNITLVQEAMRNALSREVNRRAEIARMVTREIEDSAGKADYKNYGRMARAFFYAPEVREKLGFRFTLPDKLEQPAAALYELKLVTEYCQQMLSDRDKLFVPRNKKSKKELSLLLAQSHNKQINRLIFHWQYFKKILARDQVLKNSNRDQLTNFDKEVVKLQQWLIACHETPEAARKAPEFADSTSASNLEILTKSIKDELKKRATSKDKEALEDIPTDALLSDTEYLTQWTLPDPANTTTLGQVVFVLTLGKHEARERVLEEFHLQSGELLSSAGYDILTGPDGKVWQVSARNKKSGDKNALVQFVNALRGGRDENGATVEPQFPRAVLGAFHSTAPGHDRSRDLSPNQKEVLLALQTKAHLAAASEVRFLLGQIDALGERQRYDAENPLSDNYRNRYYPLLGWLRDTVRYPNYEAAQPQKADTLKAWKTLGEEYITAVSPSGAGVIGEQRELKDVRDYAAYIVSREIGIINKLSLATPRVAAADDMIKRLIMMAENDVDQFFVQPTLAKIREAGGGVQLGTIQRESILATNRMIARVDANANADVELDAPTDFLQSATQLAELSQRFKNERKASAASSALTAGAVAKAGGRSLLSSFGVGGALGLLGVLSAQPNEPQGEVYSINSGNLFKVTPIFDPSGQALRFKFDFTSSVRVQEPDGTLNRQLPQVEHHTVNTEVQLSNMEVREISRFENNARIGVPTKRSGGVPFLKEVPVLRSIPLVGYFVKQKGSKAVSQQSLILGQTVVYPTVSEIVDLLTEIPARDTNSNIPPEYLQKLLSDVPLETLKSDVAIQQSLKSKQPLFFEYSDYETKARQEFMGP